MDLREKRAYFILVLALLYAGIIGWCIHAWHYSDFRVWWCLGMLLLKPLYHSHSYWIDGLLLYMPGLTLRTNDPHQIWAYFALVSTVLMLAAYPIRNRWIQALVAPISVCWLYWMIGIPQDLNWCAWLIGIITVLGLLIYTWDQVRPYPSMPQKWDMLLCSHSGNTAHYAAQFLEELTKRGFSIVLHRFHYYQDFHATFEQNGLMLAFPVSGWKPPWPLVAYLFSKLPPGHGKPAFILYTSSCGPENASFTPWLLLTFKGYRVIGRCWSPYPMNVVTFRLGTKKFWHRADQDQPWKTNLTEVTEVAEQFTRHRKIGLPIFLWPYPLVLLGILLDNKYLNIFLYRNYAWRSRCTKCGLCIKLCPAQRLQPNAQGYPSAHGTCSLCLLCINICPVNAMQLVGWSEYGQPYKPRWPEYVVQGTANERNVENVGDTRSAV